MRRPGDAVPIAETIFGLQRGPQVPCSAFTESDKPDPQFSRQSRQVEESPGFKRAWDMFKWDMFNRRPGNSRRGQDSPIIGEFRFPEDTPIFEIMSLRSLFGLFSNALAIDLGTANSLVYTPNRGIVVNEPSVVAINKLTDRVEAIGREAKEMLGRTPRNIVAIKPLKDGVIADFDLTEQMLKYFIKQAHIRKRLLAPRVVISTPSEITQVERRAIIQAARGAKASEVYLVKQAMAAAIGVGLPISEPSGNMIIDIGGGTTDIALISLSGIVYSRTVRVAGDEMDNSIIQYMKRKHNLLIGERTAEQIKIEIGSAAPMKKEMTVEIKGRSLIEGIPTVITITDEEVREALSDALSTIINAIRVALEQTPPELSADIADKGMVLTGGGSLLRNLDRRITKETGVPVFLAEDPLSSVVLGTGEMLSDMALLKRVCSP